MRIILTLLLLGILGYLLTGLTQVRPGERAVVRRFGRVIDTPGPGLWIGLPYGFDRVDRIPLLVRRVRVGYERELEDGESAGFPGELLTGDHNLVNIQLLLDYTIDEERLGDYVMQQDRVESMLARSAEAVVAEWVGGHKVDDVLLRGKNELPALLEQRLPARLDAYRLGIRVQGASIGYLFPPDEVKDAFDEVSRAQTGIRTAEHEARQKAVEQVRVAQAESDRITKLAAAYANEQRVVARAEARSFELRMKQYHELRRQNPNILAGIWWDEIGKLFTQMKGQGRLDLLDNHLGSDGLDITVSPPLQKK